jgi:osmotically inducible lipoprotein OsmB
MRLLRRFALGLVMITTALSGCATTTGAAVGGLAGHHYGNSRGATAAGAVAGGIIGHELGK